MNKSVYLSPSTQQENVGVGNYGTERSRMNQVADVVEKILKRHEIIVYRNNPDWKLGRVVEDSNRKNPVIHLAIHSNANDGQARGCEVYCHKYGGEGERLAKCVYEEVAAITPVQDRGVLEAYQFYGQGKPMYELAQTSAPAALVEVSFHDHPVDSEWIINHIEAIGTALAKGVLKYFNINYEISKEEAIKILNEKGLISSPDYWLQNATKDKIINGEFAEILLKRVAEILSH